MQLLDDLLAAFRSTPCAELHALVVRASAGLAPPTPDAMRGRLKGALAVWAERAKHPTSAEVPALLETLPDGGSRVAVGRMQAVNAWGPDPRVDEQIARWIDAPPWEGDIAKRFWREVFARMEKIRDPGLCKRLADRAVGGYLDSIMVTWVTNARIRAMEVAAMNLYDAKPPKTLATLTASVDEALAKPRTATPVMRSTASLLDEIRQRPDDTDVRRVYADALMAHGDPYGEFIAIQCASQSDAKSAKRAAQLLKKHGNTWLGPLVNVVMKHYVFERGFLSRCRISSSKRAGVPRLVGNPAWSTVRAIGGSTAIALDPIMLSLRELSFSGYEDPTAWRNLLVDVTRPLEHLEYRPATNYRARIDADELDALGECAALPKLQSLTVACSTEEFIALLRKPIAKRLRGIRAASAGTGFVYQGEPWVADIVAACDVPVLEIYVQCMLRVERGGDVAITLTDPRQQVGVAIALVPHLPASTKRVTLRATASVTDGDRASIAAAIRARLGDVIAPWVTIPDEVPNQVDVVV